MRESKPTKNKKKRQTGTVLEKKNTVSKKRNQPKSHKIKRRPSEEFSKKRKNDVQKNKTIKKQRKKLTQKQMQALKRKKALHLIADISKYLVPIVLLAFVVFFLIIKTSPHRVEGVSMEPTLQSGDRVIVIRTKEPMRYDVITFVPPLKSDDQYVKRVIGMPGDYLTVGYDSLMISQKKSDENSDVGFDFSEIPDSTLKVNVSKEVIEQLVDMKKIPDGYYFVMGDNRSNSADSREFGLVDQQSIEGIVSTRFYPFNRIGIVH